MKSLVGVALVIPLSGSFFLPSHRRWREIWPSMRFGLKFQSNWIVVVLGDQALNAAVGLLAGVQVLGLWSLAKKLLQAPALLFNSITGVAFPTLSDMRSRGEDPARVVQEDDPSDHDRGDALARAVRRGRTGARAVPLR